MVWFGLVWFGLVWFGLVGWLVGWLVGGGLTWTNWIILGVRVSFGLSEILVRAGAVWSSVGLGKADVQAALWVGLGWLGAGLCQVRVRLLWQWL